MIPINDAIIPYNRMQVRIACDRQCQKAWGIMCRPARQLSAKDEDDYEYLTDDELGEAPVYSTESEGGENKPSSPDDFPNKWCVRQCERSEISHDVAIVPFLYDWHKPVYNQPWKHMITGKE